MRSSSLVFLTLICLSVSTLLCPAYGSIDKIVMPQSANDYFQIGFNAATNGQYNVAVENYTNAIGQDPNRIYFFYHRGLAYKALGNKNAAIADFKQCISMKPIAEAYYELGVYKYEDLDLMGARILFNHAKELKDDVDKLNFYLGVINYRLNNYDTAEALLTHYVHLVKTNSDAFLYLAMIKVKMHKYDEVSPMLKLASLYNDNDWKLHLKMYDIYKEMDDKENMLYHISMVIELGESKPEYYAIRAALYQERGESLRAEYDLQSAKGGK